MTMSDADAMLLIGYDPGYPVRPVVDIRNEWS